LAEWQSWYARYTHKSIFVGGGPSAQYLRMSAPQHLSFITRVNRTVFHRDKRIENHSMKLCWDENDWILPSKYLPSVPNVSAGYKAFWRYDKPELEIPSHVAYMSKIWTQRHFQQFMGGSRVLPASLVRKEMDSLTSCGYPWNLTYQNKEQMYADAEMAKVIPDYCERIRENFPCGILPIWTCSVKGKEMRTVKKIEENNLRTFTAAPVEHSHATNELCLDMNDRFYNSAGRTWSQVGATKFDGQWHAMYTRLTKHANAAALDGRQFDASLLALLLWDQMWIRWEMLDPSERTMENLLALMNVYDAIISSVVVMDMGDLLRKFLGNPSGSSNTVVDNTMVLFRFMCMAWIVLAQEHRKKYKQKCSDARRPVSDPLHEEPFAEVETYGYGTMMENVEAALYGDDDTFTVSDFVRDWFTPRAIAEVWTTYGLVTTADTWEFTQLNALTFLSQSFVMVAGLWMPSPETEKVLGSLYLGSSVDDIRFHLLRAYALRIESWANDECRLKIETYINYVHTHYRDQLIGMVRDIDWSAIRQVWKTDLQILKLYTGEECASSVNWSHIFQLLRDEVWVKDSPQWRLVGVELNPGPQTSIYLNMHSLFKILSLSLCYQNCANTSGIRVNLLSCVFFQCVQMPGKKKTVKKAAKKEAVKEVKKILKHAGPRKAKPKKNVLHGRGGYWGDLGKRLGGHLGGVADEVVGIGKVLTGRGRYQVKRNSIYESGRPPTIMNTKHSSIIRHCDYIADVVGSPGFSITQYAINPGVFATFPWLSQMASMYEQYIVRGMIFEFRSTSADAVASTNTALGTVIMATEYNSNLPAFANKMQMENHEYSTSVCPDRSAIHPVECARSRTVLDELYIRTSTSNNAGTTTVAPSNYTPLLYDLGQFYLATVGMQAAATVGELWVSYEIEFLKPTIPTTVASNTPVHYYWDSTLGTQPVSGNLLRCTRNKNTGVVLYPGNGNAVAIPFGRWVMIVQFIQGSASITAPTLTYTGCSALAMFDTAAATGISADSVSTDPANGTTTTTGAWLYGIDVTTAAGGSVAFSTCTIGTLTTFDVFLLPYAALYSATRNAVEWDPVARISRRLLELEGKLSQVLEVEEKYDSECSTPMHVEPVLTTSMTQSTQDLASSLLSRLQIGNAVTRKGHFPSAA